MQITFEVPEEIVVTSRGVDCVFRPDSVQADKLESFARMVFIAGITKAGVDAASGAKSYAADNELDEETATKELIEKRFAVWSTGEWTSRGVGTGESAEEREAKSILRAIVKAQKPKDYKEASPEYRETLVGRAWESLKEADREALLAQAKTSLEAKREAAAKRAEEVAALGKLSISLE